MRGMVVGEGGRSSGVLLYFKHEFSDNMLVFINIFIGGINKSSSSSCLCSCCLYGWCTTMYCKFVASEYL